MEHNELTLPEDQNCQRTPSAKRRRIVSPTKIPKLEMVTQTQSQSLTKTSHAVIDVSTSRTEFIPPKANNRQKFEDNHTRITTYLQNDVHNLVRRLYDEGKIRSVTSLVNEAVRQYLSRHYQF